MLKAKFESIRSKDMKGDILFLDVADMSEEVFKINPMSVL